MPIIDGFRSADSVFNPLHHELGFQSLSVVHFKLHFNISDCDEVESVIFTRGWLKEGFCLFSNNVFALLDINSHSKVKGHFHSSIIFFPSFRIIVNSSNLRNNTNVTLFIIDVV